MSPALTVTFDDQSAKSHRLVGGKGANLGVLAGGGFNVPPGFTVTTEAYVRFLELAELKPRIRDLLSTVQLSDPDALESATASIRRLITDAQMPPTLASEIADRYATLGSNVHVAVRSSGTAEDLAGASFAGLHDSYLDIRGEADVLDAVRRCWASLWSARAVSYRETRGFDHFESPIGVVVQQMIESEVSGVMFSANPMTEATDELVINASWGIGEALVQGLVTPDEFTVQHGDLRTLDRTLGSKQLTMKRDSQSGSGVRTEDTPQALRDVFCLPDGRVRELAGLGREIQAHYGDFPQDIEWAFAGGRFYILQARPITAVNFAWDAEVTLSVPGARLTGDEVWSRGWADEGWTGGVTPLMFSWRAYGWSKGQDDAFRTFGYPELATSVMRMFAYHKGKPYYNAELDRELNVLTCPPPFRAAPQALSRIPKSWQAEAERRPFDYWRWAKMWARVETLTPAVGVFFPKRMAANWSLNPQRDAFFDGLSDTELRSLDDRELKAYVRQQIENEIEFYYAIWTGVLVLFRDEMGFLATLVGMWYDGDNESLLAEILSGTPQQTITQAENKELWDLAQQIRHSATLREVFDTSSDGASFLTAIEGAPDGESFLKSYRAFVAKRGHRGHRDRDIYFTRRAEDPDIDYRFLTSMLSVGETVSPETREAESNRRRNAAIEEACRNIKKKPLGTLKVGLFKTVVNHIHEVIAARDLQRYTIDRSTYAIKKGFMEVARRLLERGELETWRDHYFLTMDELFDLFDGRVNRSLTVSKIAARMKNFDAVDQNEVSLPMFIQRGSALEIDEPEVDDSIEGVYRGRGTSPGTVVGRARVVHSPKELGRVREGEILITNSTDPGWTPVFMVITGIVLETGGLLAHGSLLAREYGFPAVQVERATQLIPDGALISVNGSSGIVTVLPEEEQDVEAVAASESRTDTAISV
jgi:pyruvate,water dikinase